MTEDINDASDAQELATASAKLRSFEDDVFGKDASRINGEVERGVGSPFAKMTDVQRAHHTALENLVKAEKAVADAGAAHAKAHADHELAEKKAAAAALAAGVTKDEPVIELPAAASDHEI